MLCIRYMMKTINLVGLLLACLGPTPVWGAEIKLLPGDIVLTGPHANQRLILVAQEDGFTMGDLTASAKFVSSAPSVAAVDEAGVVRAKADGSAVITASHDGK